MKKEIVFFPGRAAAWNAMESIWLAASRSGDCNVHVVPIPWLELDESHYEGSCFPDHVIITHFKDYCVSDIKPDIAFIDNPYDDKNDSFITASEYWSYNLKLHVKKLVLIPSFGWGTPGWGTAQASEKIKNSAADLIVAESEDFASWCAETGIKADIYFMGNPRLDKLFNSMNVTIPESWQMLRGKTVFFLNSSIASLKKNPDAYLGKLEGTIAFFRRNKDKYALLWRPHPALVATIKKNCPHKLDTYLDLLETVEQDGLGVLDKTADTYAAIDVSNAYIGDRNSFLFAMYGLTGKPVFVYDWTCPIDKDPNQTKNLETMATFYNLAQNTMLDTNSCKWGIHRRINALFKIPDVKTGKSVYVSSIPGERNIESLYDTFFLYDNGSRIMLAPTNAQEWAEYDIKADVWTKYPRFEREFIQPGKLRGFSCAVQTEKYLFFIPFHAKVFARFDKQKRQFEVFGDWYDEFEQLCESEDKNLPVFSHTIKHVVVGNTLWLCTPRSNVLCELDLETMRPAWRRCGPAHFSYGIFDFDGTDFWLNRRCSGPNFVNTLVRWNLQTGKTVLYTDLSIDLISYGRKSAFSQITALAGYIWLGASNNKYNVRFNPVTAQAEPFLLGNEEELLNAPLIHRDMTCQFNKIFKSYCRDNILGGYSRDNAEWLYDMDKRQFIFRSIFRISGIHKLMHTQESVIPGLWREYDGEPFFSLERFAGEVSAGIIPAVNPELTEHIKALFNIHNTSGKVGEEIWLKISTEK